MLAPGKMMQVILSKPSSICMVAVFPSMDRAITALTKLSYASIGADGNPAFPNGILCGLYKDKAGAMAVIGGPLTEKQRAELYEVVQRHGKVQGFTYSDATFGATVGDTRRDAESRKKPAAARDEAPRKEASLAVEAAGATEARVAAMQRMPEGAEITKIVQVQQGAKGFLGVGKRLALFKVHYLLPAAASAPAKPS